MATRRGKVAIGVLAAGFIAAYAAIAFRPVSPPFEYLKNYPLQRIYAAEGPTRASNGEYPLVQIYAFTRDFAELARQIDQAARAEGNTQTAAGWQGRDQISRIEIRRKAPRELTAPGPAGTTGYVLTVEPQVLSPSDRLWKIWLRWRYR